MTYILHLETATRNCSVSLAKDGELVAVREIAESGYTHAEKLHVFIEEVLKEAQILPNNLTAIAVSQGPGSYTGLRIGVSAAKGLCYALNIPLIALDTLEILSKQIKILDGLIVPMIDARRMECYTAIFSKDYEQKRKVESQIIESNIFSEFQETIHLLGDGASKCKEVLNTDQFVYHDQAIFPSSKEMVQGAYHKFLNNDFVDVAYFEPFYLKEFMLNTKQS
ncbi:tRNA (adenosine(37)-N6)-threonylcarbamoyltransferase complex dimerization subunit type 1 TsaB [Flavobacterium oreochromis]|uniref:tRNA (Adenosine(37)-N6)-threonylcarbamoyltransferase complex dimerization subunit type 1 TsaB n=1 Tax=Flavobacterium columnare TaxID=996 RepID=A0A246G7T0_9FLAO|nr:tRNA (adenosine(37)-N6)-threonylcarbamoyltransferase complex dimerization subunit type 1 TsaB [Flavobacterium oreochromis]OWP74636.1 tRNA (adenosine(37)-N6)-threonylcarbamoyltransferase complex dimerization subunit type 1 TsaB [Flavobacterium oreochromis]POR27005.1 tRNA (adenosine(37)-N6)-threonylcarbamoyltransferase complex dimerization subunit type 1 TsaB [Flavobacterium columnare]QYS86944.1 tRNA (adenosine(37)-N6)-threonylcarbamoyltransferase complex dimerization subunit type 1 TsaB [Flavo